MKTFNKSNRSVAMAGVAATLAVAAMGFAGAAQARDNVSFSVGIGLPAYPVYQQPVYVQPAPVYYEPAPVYYRPAPVYYQQAPVYVAPQQVYYGRPHGWHGRHGGGYYVQAPRGYGPVYYGR